MKISKIINEVKTCGKGSWPRMSSFGKKLAILLFTLIQLVYLWLKQLCLPLPKTADKNRAHNNLYNFFV